MNIPKISGLRAALWAFRLKDSDMRLSTHNTLHKKFGDIVEISIFGSNMIFIYSPEIAKEVFRNKDKAFIKNEVIGKAARGLMGSGLVFTEGNEWKSDRKVVLPEFSREKVKAYKETFITNTKKLTERWDQKLCKEEFIERDIQDDIHWLSLMIASETLFGVDFGEHAKFLMKGSHEYIDFGVQNLLFPFFKKLQSRKNRKMENFIRKVDEIVYSIIEKERSRFSKGDETQTNVLSRLVQSGLNTRKIRDHIVTLLLAAHETTLAMVSWTLYFLVQNPAHLNILNSKLHEGKDSDFSEYLRQCLKETTRLVPPAPIISRSTKKDVNIHGYEVKRESQVFFAMHIPQVSDRFWESPLEYRPSRFSSVNEKSIVPFSYFAFGSGGNRPCIGEEFALFEGEVIIKEILKKYSISLVDQEKPVKTVGMNIKAKNGLFISINKKIKE